MKIKRFFTIAALVSGTAACSGPHATSSRTKVAGDVPAAGEAEEQDARKSYGPFVGMIRTESET